MASPDSFNLQPPTLGPQFPVYPHLTQAVRVTAATAIGPSRTVSSTVLSGPVLYISYVQQLDPSTLLPRDREPCFVVNLNGAGVLSPGYYVARLAGQYGGLPVYELGSEPSPTLQFVSQVCVIPGSMPNPCTFPTTCDQLRAIILSMLPTVQVYTSLLDPNAGIVLMNRVCNPACLQACPSGTGSGPSGCVACGGCSTDSTAVVTVLGITNGNCANCAAVNGTYVLSRGDPTNPASCAFGMQNVGGGPGGWCVWCGPIADGGCGSPFAMILWYDVVMAEWRFQMGIGANGGQEGVLEGSWSCADQNTVNTFSISDNVLGGYCHGPVTIKVKVGCGHSGGGWAPCSSCTGGSPLTWAMSPSGFSGGPCGAYNGSWTLTQGSSACAWAGTLAGASAQLSIGGLATLTLTDGADFTTYSTTFNGNCCAPLTLSLGSTSCTSSPGTIVLTPNCSGGPVTPACCPSGLPTTLIATVVGHGGCACYSGTYVLNYIGGDIWEDDTTTLCGQSTGGFLFEAGCSNDGTVMRVAITGYSVGGVAVPLDWSGCSLPQSWTGLDIGHITGDPNFPCAGTIDLTISG